MPVELSELEKGTSNLGGILQRANNLASDHSTTNEKEMTYRHLRVVCILVCSNTDRSLYTSLDVTLVGVHIHQLEPWFHRKSWTVKTSLICFFCLFLMMQAKAEISQDLPFHTSLPISNMLGFEVRNFSAKDSPDAQVLLKKLDYEMTKRSYSYLIQDHEEVIEPSLA